MAQFITFTGFECQCYILDAVGHQVQPQQLYRKQRQGKTAHQGQGKQNQLGSTGRDQQEYHLAHIRVGDAPLFDAGDDGVEIIIGNDDIRSLAGNIGTALAHGDTNLRRL